MLFEVVACHGCPTFRRMLGGDIGSRQAIPSKQWLSCAPPETVRHTAACDPNNRCCKGHAFFLRKDVAAQVQLPSRRMLREEAQRRIKIAHKKKWEEYGLG
jgi:hypothetical protein